MTQHAHAGNSGSPSVAPHDLAAIAAYWSEERRRAAKPAPLPRVRTHAMPLPPGTTGRPGETTHGHGFERHDTPVGGNGRTMLQPLNYPYRTCGRIFFDRGGESFAASAAMVAPNVLLTAGHCAHADGEWSTRMTFFPSYGARLVTDMAFRYACGRLACRTSWIDSGDRAHDYALVWMETAPGNLIGWLGLLWNAPTAGRVWEAVGYPATPDPIGRDAMEATLGNLHAVPTCSTINDMAARASSGGPWITNWNETARSHANGLQGFHVHDAHTIEHGPCFTEDVKALFDWIRDPANH